MAKQIGRRNAAIKAQLIVLRSGLATSIIPMKPIPAAKNFSFVSNSPKNIGAKKTIKRGVENSNANNWAKVTWVTAKYHKVCPKKWLIFLNAWSLRWVNFIWFNVLNCHARAKTITIPASERQSIISKLFNSPPNSLPDIAIRLKLKTAPSIQKPAFIEAEKVRNIRALFYWWGVKAKTKLF